ncbi:M23 family metallopeptidase [Peptococcaceae bacterium 1198_IL3148]
MPSKLIKNLIYVVTILLTIIVLAAPTYGQLTEMIDQGQPYGVDRVDYQIAPEPVVETKATTVKPNAVEHYRVVSGDTLWGLANKFGISVAQLAALNGLDEGSQLFMGQVIDLPGTSVKHTVKSGDTLIGICKQYQISMSQLLKANNITNPDLVQVGKTLTIPGQNAAVPTMSAGTKTNLPVLAMSWPVQGRISSEFGIRGEEGRPHQGLDIAANQGALISAPCSGEVVFSGYYGTYGNTVIIDHGDNMRTLYAHCSTLLVKNGQWVQAGNPIARVGNTGRSSGPHLHWEVTYKGVPFDPMFCINATNLPI